MKIYKTLMFFTLPLFTACTFGESNQIPDVVRTYEKQLKEEWEHIEKDFLCTLRISKQTWETFKKNHQDQYKEIENDIKADQKKEAVPLSDSFKNVITKLFASLNIDTTNIDFSRNDKTHRLSSTDSAIFISEDQLQEDNLTGDQLQAALLHEMQHIFHKDHSTLCFLGLYAQKNLLKKIKLFLFKRYRKKYEDLFVRVAHFREKRADIGAGLHSLKYAKALLNFYKAELVNYEDKDTNTHPKTSKRVAYMQKLVDDMESDHIMSTGCLYKLPIKR